MMTSWHLRHPVLEPTPRGRALAWSLAAFALAANAAGYAFDLYQQFWWSDRARWQERPSP